MLDIVPHCSEISQVALLQNAGHDISVSPYPSIDAQDAAEGSGLYLKKKKGHRLSPVSMSSSQKLSL